jgi:oxygen-independent coproporphyrinogen-3 oxidase
MGRLHGPDGPPRAVAAAREAGFDNLSIDLIFGVPERLGRDWREDLERAIALEPEHVSLYGLTAEAGAPLGKWVREGREALADEDRYAEEFLLAHELLTKAGYEHYEVSNFARPGRRSRHNAMYWTGAPYAAVGPGAHAYFPPQRRWNLRSWDAYRETLGTGRLPLDGDEVLDPPAVELERIWLGLRTSEGYELADPSPAQTRLIDRWCRQGLATAAVPSVRLHPRGWLLLDQLAVDLQEAGDATRGARRSHVIDDRRPLVQISANSNPLFE